MKMNNEKKMKMNNEKKDFYHGDIRQCICHSFAGVIYGNFGKFFEYAWLKAIYYCYLTVISSAALFPLCMEGSLYSNLEFLF